jgi:hypothetical protein
MNVGVVEEGVNVWQKLVSNRHGRLACINNRGPSVSFLANGTKDVMVSVEGEEGAQLHPAITELHIGVISKSTGVSSEHRNTKKRHRKSLRDGKDHTWPVRPVITTPMASISSRARECRATDDEWPDTWEDSRKSSICGLEDTMTEKVVHFVFLSAICVGGIGRDGSNT